MPNSSPVLNCLLQESQAKQAKWYTCSRAFRTQSAGEIIRLHLKHLAPNNLKFAINHSKIKILVRQHIKEERTDVRIHIRIVKRGV